MNRLNRYIKVKQIAIPPMISMTIKPRAFYASVNFQQFAISNPNRNALIEIGES